MLYMLTSLVICHSWVEQVMRIALNGTLIGPVGYMRGYVGRSDPGFVDHANTHLLPPNGRSEGVVLNSDGICSPSQKIGNYSPKYPMLSAAPGDFIALRYQENGHVSLPGSGPPKPENRGTIYIYGTSEPDDNHKVLDIHQKWAAGREKGRLIATRPFDDGQCYQINNGAISVKRQDNVRKVAKAPQGADLWCQADVRLPRDLPTSGIYTLYWVWDWPTITDECKVASPQLYTSCLDIELRTEGISNEGSIAFISNQDPNDRAILEQMQM